MSAADLDLKDLYERYGRAVYKRCQYFLKNAADAEDAMHEVFVKVALAHHDFKGEASPLTWMVRITTNHCMNVLRSKKAGWRSRYETTVKVDAAERPPSETSRLERQELVHVVLHKVSREAQAAAVYYFVDEMTQEDAAAACECSVPTLRKRLREFIRVARRELKKQDAELVFGEEPI